MDINREFDDFDQFASEYRTIHNQTLKVSGVSSDYFSEHKVQIIHENEKDGAMKCLDFGCGDGQSSVFFIKYFPTSQYYGIDVSKESIRVAKTRALENVFFDDFDGYTLPFEKETFDVVYASCVFHHIEFKNHLDLLAEIKRVLKPGGRFYIFEHNPYNPITRRIVNTCPFDADAVLLYPQYTKKELTKSGFSEVVLNYILFFPRTKLFQPLIKLEKYFKKLPLGGQYYTIAIK